MRSLLCSLINATLCGKQFECSGVSEEEWQRCFTTWSRFADTLTAIAIHQLGLSQEWFPANEIETANSINEVQEQRVWNDIISSPRTPKSKSSNFRRIYIAKRMLKNSWKYKTYSNISASKLLIKEFVVHVRGRSLTTIHFA